MRLEVIPVESLFRHEDTLPHVVDELLLEFRNWANLQNPIIVDENNMVLDGNHRAFVFKELKFKYIPGCRINYFNKNVELRYWFRLLENIEGVDLLKQIVEDMNGKLQQVDDQETLKKTLKNNNLDCGIQQGNFYASIRFNKDLVNDAVSAYAVLGKIQDKLIEKSIKLKYFPCQHMYETKFCRELKECEMVIWTPQITKEMVLAAVKRKKLFAPRTTRHLISPRPLNVNVPLYWFKENISLEGINRRFSQFLASKNLEPFGPGQVIDGRYYGEELLFFFDKKQ
ncbi:MAG: hypothetical protein JSW12_18585 [Deltaproteobacteria bacterium]|nr:MAG: hypothetical protein JSW12_18585 [Deltaproteobacteria bacterium]